MYDAISNDYDHFVNWSARLAVEIPFIDQQLRMTVDKDSQVLDAACGTGMHTIALAQLGYRMSGADLSCGMIDRARSNARSAGVNIHFESVGFGQLANIFSEKPFDALLCLGNSLPHILNPTALDNTFLDFKACLRSGGLLLIQNRNFDGVLKNRERWMEPQEYRENGAEWLFLRFYDFDADGLLNFHMITLHRKGISPWAQQVTSTRLYPFRQAELVNALHRTGYAKINCFGNMSGSPFDQESSGNLIISAISQ